MSEEIPASEREAYRMLLAQSAMIEHLSGEHAFGEPLPKIEPLKIDLDKLYDHAGRAKHDAAVDAMAARAQRRREQVQSEISRELDALHAQAISYERLAKLTWEKWENLKEMAGL